MQIYYDSDVDQNIAKGMEIVILVMDRKDMLMQTILKIQVPMLRLLLEKNLDHGQKLKPLVLMSKR